MDRNKNIWIALRRIAAGCFDWPIAVIIGLVGSAFVPVPVHPSLWPTALTVLLLIICFYFILFECSPLQATPGKMLFRLNVQNSSGRSISIWQAAIYRLLQCAFVLVLAIGLTISGSVAIFCFIFLGFASAVYWLFSRYLKLIPPMDLCTNRVIRENIKNTVQNENICWSLGSIFASNLSWRQCLCGLIGLIIVTGAPGFWGSGLFQSFQNFFDNRSGSVKGPVVYAIKDVPEGTIITKDDLEIRKIVEYRIPQDAFTSIDQAVGQTCSYGIAAGHIVSYHDTQVLR